MNILQVLGLLQLLAVPAFTVSFFMLTILIVLYYYRFISTVPYDTGKYSFDFIYLFFLSGK